LQICFVNQAFLGLQFFQTKAGILHRLRRASPVGAIEVQRAKRVTAAYRQSGAGVG
jgi:hypothetical protein